MENEINSVKNFGANQTKSTKSSFNKLTFNSEIKDSKVIGSSSKTSSPVSQVSLVNISGCPPSANNNNSSQKMGSRRIFTPQFKLQVLESYRNDSDCKGNQRATARKYNIHRRQIQKWLQCECSLRSSVANINHNTVKHQFHNINIQQQSQKLSIPNNSTYGSSNQHSAHLPLDSSRPPLATTPASQKPGVFAAADLAAVVAAAGGVMAVTRTSSSSSTSAPTKTVVSPLRPSAIIGTSGNTSATMSPLLHHHHYGIPPYTHAPAGVPLSVPILTHHISHPHHIRQHIHQQTQQHQLYQYHNLACTQSLIHQPENKQSYSSSASLPTINALSAVSASTSNGFAKGEIAHTDLLDAPQLRITCSNVTPANKGYLYNDELASTYAKYSNSIEGTDTNASEPYSVYQLRNDGYSSLSPHGPIDLSLRPRREVKTELFMNVKSNVNYETKHSERAVQNCLNGESKIVDLTYRKRKVANISNTVDEFPEKQAKLISATGKETIKCNIFNIAEFCLENVPNTENCSEEDDSEIEVGTEEKNPPSKPVKLFKPYLLDDYENNLANNVANKVSENEQANLSEKSLWISEKRVSPSHSYSDISVELYRENTFQASLTDNFSTTLENSNFLGEIKTGSLRSAFSPTASVPTLSPTIFHCPKGSPVSSGYDSSTSTYSESSLSSRSEACAYGRTYSINLQMHTIYNDNIVFNSSKHVQRWLDQEESNPPAPNSSIALFV